ncbi:MAG: Vitamin B12 import ATP-binding protein BtuD [Elusimicrobia bacterium]|nr:Vitamin B12 import ATP-binding protein BtuD [Elusimicrobiota bacterium]
MRTMKKHSTPPGDAEPSSHRKGSTPHGTIESPPIAVDIKDMSKKYGSFEALKNINLQVAMGKVCCLLGPNGSGKTTLLKILAGLLDPTTGSLNIHGIDRMADPRSARADIGWMPAEERSGLYGRITGRENLNFFGTLHGLTAEELNRTIGNISFQIGIDDELDKNVQRVSSGTKQKIGLARALLHNPPILLLDEPIRNLDPETTVRFRRLLKDHLTRIQKKTVLLSTHLLEEARRVADMIVIIRKGEIVKVIEGLDLENELKAATLEEIYLKTVGKNVS